MIDLDESEMARLRADAVETIEFNERMHQTKSDIEGTKTMATNIIALLDMVKRLRGEVDRLYPGPDGGYTLDCAYGEIRALTLQRDRLDAEVGATLNRLQAAHEERDRLAAENERLKHANDSLNMQLQDRIKLEHDHKAYVECAKEKRDWVRKCANRTSELADLRDENERLRKALGEVTAYSADTPDIIHGQNCACCARHAALKCGDDE